jgi:hypothetical protein
MNIDRELLVRIDSICSLVAHRGIDEDARHELLLVAHDCRLIYDSQIGRVFDVEQTHE